MPTGVFNPLKLTDRLCNYRVFSFVNGSDIYYFTKSVVSFKQTVLSVFLKDTTHWPGESRTSGP